LAGKLNGSHLDHIFRALGSIRGDRQTPAGSVESDHPPQGGEASASRRSANGINAEESHRTRDKLSVAMLADQHSPSPPVGEERQHEEPLVPESDDEILTAVPELIGPLLMENLFALGQGEETQDERGDSGKNQEKKFLAQTPPPWRR
jgi:hypothetical protein